VTDVRKLIEELAGKEERLRAARFVAPCVRGGRVRTRVDGLLCTFAPKPRDWEGWGFFRPLDARTAAVESEATLPLVAEYLGRLPAMRLRLARSLRGRTWLAYPVNESDARQRLGQAKPVSVHLVAEGTPFETIIARWDGAAWWFEEVDRRADPTQAERLREAAASSIPPGEIRFSGCTPEMRAVYELATRAARELRAKRQEQSDEARLGDALRMGGGRLQQFHDRGDFWLVEWTTADGERHHSAIGKRDLTVVSAGICLSDEDEKFDLQSLVGVVERQWID
jgi:hypothetical protein